MTLHLACGAAEENVSWPAKAGHPRLVNPIRTATPGMPVGWVYIMSNRPNGTLYVGVTNDVRRRAYEHKVGAVDGFTHRYGLDRLVYA